MSAVRGPASPFFVFYGEEDFFLDRGAEVARRWPGRDVRFIDADEGLTEAELTSMLEMVPADETQRTFIIDNAQKLKETKAKLLRKYVEGVSPRDVSTVLVGIVRAEKLSDLWTFIGTKGKTTEHKKFKPWADKSGKTEYEKWLETEAKRVGLGFELGVTEFICQMCGDDLYRLLSELKKLYTLVGNGNKVTMKHVSSVIAITPKSEPKDVVEYAFAKNRKEAMNSLSQVYKTMGDEASIPIVYGLMRESQKALSARAMLDKGSSDEDIATALGQNPWRCKTFFLPMVRKHSQSSLLQYMRRLCKLDTDVKGSSRSKRTQVELTVLTIAG